MGSAHRRTIEALYDYIYSGTDACYDRGSSYRLRWFPNDEAPKPNIIKNWPFFRHGSRSPPRPWEFEPGSNLFFSE